MKWIFVFLLILIALFGCDSYDFKKQTPGSKQSSQWGQKSQLSETFNVIKPLDLSRYDGGFFSIDKPNRWKIVTAGQCALFAFYLNDPENDLNQVFYFGNVGPVYINQQQKQTDLNYMHSGGFRIQHIEMPVVQPATPSNFLKQWFKIASTSVARRFMPSLPKLYKLQIINSQSISALKGGRSALIRAVFQKNGRVGEGLFLVNLVPNMPYTGGPGGGTIYGVMITGITAAKQDFVYLQKSMNQIISSFNVSQQYANQCIQSSQKAFSGIKRAGQTLQETSDIIIKGWENRNRTYDILAEKRSDTILEKERVYDVNTGEVYEFDQGFYKKYKLNPNRYNKPDLKLLPVNDYKLWSARRLIGSKHVHLE